MDRRLGGLLVAILLLPLAGAQSPDGVAWPSGKFNPYEHLPIRVHFDESNLSAETRPYLDEVRAAMAYWEAGGNGGLEWVPRFAEVLTRGQADVVVWFTDGETATSCNDGVDAAGCGGYGGPRYTQAYGTVELAMRLPRGKGDMSLALQHVPYDALREVAKHEFGHALGLPHSSVPGDVMAPEGDFVTRHEESPDTLWAVKNLHWVALGFAGLVGVVLGGQWVLHRSRRARDDDERFR